jgi:competence protein ComEC
MPALATPPPLALPATRGDVSAAVVGLSTKTEPLAFSKAPALFAACCFAGGILLARSHWCPPPVLLIAGLLTSCVVWTANRAAVRMALIPLMLSWVTLGALCFEIEPQSDPQVALVAFANGASHAFEGRIVRLGPPRMVESTMPYTGERREEQSQVLDLRVYSVDAQPVKGGLGVTIYAPTDTTLPSLNCGDALRISLPIHLPDRYNDPGVWDGRAYMLQQGVSVLGSTKASNLVALPGVRHPTMGCRLQSLQQSAALRLMAFADRSTSPIAAKLPAWLRMSHNDAAMLSAMIAGDRTWLQQRVRVGFERTGSFHLLVVSGMHLAIFAGLVFWIAGRLHLQRAIATAATIVLSLAYAVFTGFGQPVQRSFWMVTLYLVARLLWREKNALNAIGFAGLCLLVFDPNALFEAGFQMTLLSVIAIGGIAAPIMERSFAPYLRATRTLSLVALDPSLPPPVAQFRVSLRLIAEHLGPLLGRRFARKVLPAFIRLLLRAAELLLISATIELVMSLPMAIYFHRITVLALPVNVLIVPFLGVLLPSALLTFVVLLLLPSFAVFPAAVTAGLLHVVVGTIQTFANLRNGDFRIPGPQTGAIAGFILLLIFAIWAVRRLRFRIPIAVMALLGAALLVIVPRSMERRGGVLEVTAIDVGQGDSLLVVSPEGKTLLIDGGGSPFGPPPGISRFDIGEDVVSQVLWSRGIRRLDAVALTHAHADHIGGLATVLANFRPRELWVGRNPHSVAYDNLIAEAAHLDIAIRSYAEGDRLQFGGAEIAVLAPAPDYQPGDAPSNNDSLAMRIRYGDTSALLEGDAESPSEGRMLQSEPLHSDLLKVGHHGSRTSTTPEFFKAVSPSFAVISVGRRNMYGHPRREVLQELQDAHVRTYRTDMLGLSTFYLDGKQVTAGTFPSR